MPWLPTYSIINSRAIAENLLTYFEANQVEAILWAHGSALKPIARFENSVAEQNVPVYPAMQFVSDNDATDYAESYPRSAYSVTYEVLTVNAEPATAVEHARSYAKAVVSMIRNCPQATYAANAGVTASASVLLSVETGFDPIKKHDTQTMFLQQFQVRATYTLEGAGI